VNKPVVIFVAMLALLAGIKASAETYTPLKVKPAPNTTVVPMTPFKSPAPTAPVKPLPLKKAFYILPPAEYDHPYEGDLTIKIVATLEELYALCGLKEDITPNALACAFPSSNSCIFLLVSDEIMRKRGWTTGLLFRHEIGHCNGWPGDHPGERPLIGPISSYFVGAHERVKIPLVNLERAERIKAQEQAR
jgi:hypothetical protein